MSASTSNAVPPGPMPAGEHSRSPIFVTTQWSVVLAAGDNETTAAAAALTRLCQTYWFPLYAYVRRRGYDVPDAQDLTQEFFARLLQKNLVALADRERGRFRSFLLTSLNSFLANEWRRSQRQKRGGGAQIIPIQIDTAETRYGMEPADKVTPEQIFERRWALTLLTEVLRQLEAEYTRDGKSGLFAALKPCLVGDRDSLPYAKIAAQLDLNETTIRVTVHRLRQRYRQLLRAEIAQTVAEPGEVDEEMRHLLAVVSRG